MARLSEQDNHPGRRAKARKFFFLDPKRPPCRGIFFGGHQGSADAPLFLSPPFTTYFLSLFFISSRPTLVRHDGAPF